MTEGECMAEDPLQLLLDLEEIKKLKHRYFRLLDAKNWDEFADLFTEDLEFFYAVPDQQFVPPDAVLTAGGWAQVDRDRLLSFLRGTNQQIRTVHHCHMPEITMTGPDAATGRWRMNDYTECPGDGGNIWVRGFGDYEDEYARTERGWRITKSVFYRYEMDPMPGF